jgi:copper homeostasis protein
MTDRRILLEIPVASVADAVAAEQGGADRIELNSAMPLGGLTPSLGLFAEVKRRVRIPIMVMIRPRPGGFCYSDSDIDVMRRDIELALGNGADGLVFGVLDGQGRIDQARCRSLLELIGGRLPAVFHRAFDLTPDPFAAVEELVALGFRRLMTSGQEQTAYEGAWRISSIIDAAEDRIEVLPAGGINRFNVADVLARTGCEQIHCGLRCRQSDTSASGRPGLFFGSARTPEDQFDATDLAAVREMRSLLP